MNHYKQNIGDFTAKIKNLTNLIEYKLTDIGKLIASLKDVSIDSAQFLAIYHEILDIKKRIPETSRTVIRIDKATANLNAINREIAENKKLILEKEKETASVFEKIGQVAYTVFKSKNMNFNGFGDIFDALRKLDEKAAGYRNNDGSDIDSNKPVLTQIVTIAKAIYSSQAYQINLGKYSKAYRAAGELVAKSDYGKEVGESQLDEALESLRRVQEELVMLTGKQDGFLVKKKKISDTLEAVGVKASPHSRIRELEIEQKKLETSLKENYYRIGLFYLDNPKVVLKVNADIEKLLAEIKQLSKEKDKYTSELKKNEASIEIDIIREKMRKAAKKVEQLTLAIRKNEAEIKIQKDRLAQLEKEKHKFDKILDIK
jgi:hypothetical protein